MNSSQNKNRTEQAHRDLNDIRRGYSRVRVASSWFYFKHITLTDTLELGSVYESALEAATRNGLKTEQELLSAASKRGKWGLDKEEKIKGLEWQLGKSKEQAEKISDSGQKRIFLEQSIPPLEKEVAELRAARQAIIAYSAESYALQAKNKQFALMSVFKNENLTEECDLLELNDVLSVVFPEMERMSQRNTLASACYLTPFFQAYIVFKDNPRDIFERPAFDTTVYQRSLLDISASIYGKMTNHTIPEDILQDPIKILEYDPDKKSKDSSVTYGVGDLTEKSKKSGGKLSAKDLLS